MNFAQNHMLSLEHGKYAADWDDQWAFGAEPEWFGQTGGRSERDWSWGMTGSIEVGAGLSLYPGAESLEFQRKGSDAYV